MKGRLAVLVVVASSWAGGARARETPVLVDLWPGRPPGETGEVGPEKDLSKPTDGQVAGRPVVRLGNVARPSIKVLRPPAGTGNGTAVLIAPGGGYHILAWDLEGEEVAAWLNSLGVTAVVLKYRVPRRPGQPGDQPPPGPKQDAQRALSLVRARAREWGIDPGRIGMLGFSAGGHLTAATATGFEQRTYEPVDEADKASCRPDFVVLVYPAYLVTKDKVGLLPEMKLSARTPPMFLVHAADDPVPAENSVHMWLGLKKAGVPAELHVFPNGGHGYGLRPTERAVTGWPKLCEGWLRRQGLLRPAG